MCKRERRSRGCVTVGLDVILAAVGLPVVVVTEVGVVG